MKPASSRNRTPADRERSVKYYLRGFTEMSHLRYWKCVPALAGGHEFGNKTIAKNGGIWFYLRCRMLIAIEITLKRAWSIRGMRSHAGAA